MCIFKVKLLYKAHLGTLKVSFNGVLYSEVVHQGIEPHGSVVVQGLSCLYVLHSRRIINFQLWRRESKHRWTTWWQRCPLFGGSTPRYLYGAEPQCPFIVVFLDGVVLVQKFHCSSKNSCLQFVHQSIHSRRYAIIACESNRNVNVYRVTYATSIYPVCQLWSDFQAQWMNEFILLSFIRNC